jgi:SNF2 family DNA or RNA helicase
MQIKNGECRIGIITKGFGGGWGRGRGKGRFMNSTEWCHLECAKKKTDAARKIPKITDQQMLKGFDQLKQSDQSMLKALFKWKKQDACATSFDPSSGSPSAYVDQNANPQLMGGRGSSSSSSSSSSSKGKMKRQIKPSQTLLSEQEAQQLLEKRLPRTLLKALMPFQRTGVIFGIKRHGCCMIADEMGLGKTIQAISLAWVFRNDWPLLVVVPSAVKYNWAEEIQRWLPDLPPTDVHIVSSRYVV